MAAYTTYANPGWVNGTTPAINKTNLDNISDAIVDLQAKAGNKEDTQTITGTWTFNSGKLLATSPLFTTQITTPKVLGGTGTTQTLTYQTTSGIGAAGADHIFLVGNNGATEAMRILNSGLVGIGISPTSTLHIEGATGKEIKVRNTGNDNAGIWIDSNRTVAGDNIGQFTFGWNNVQRGGIRGIAGPDTTNKDDLTIGVIVCSGGSQSQSVTFLYDGKMGIGMTPTTQLELSTDSAQKPTTNTWAITSDIRLKTNIELANIDRCYEIIKNLPLKKFRWRDDIYGDTDIKDRNMLGWIADDVKAVFPKAVSINRFEGRVMEEDGIEEYKEDNKTKTRIKYKSKVVIDDCLTLQSDQIYKVMYGTIQKLIEKVERLEKMAAVI